MMILAGHTYLPFHDRCSGCGKPILDLMDVTRDDIGRHGIAHVGALNVVEYDQIEEYRIRCLGAAKG